MTPSWLPSLVLLTDYGGNWDDYLKAVHKFFRADFVASRPNYRDQPVKIKSMPYDDNKEATFWHLVSEGKREEERTPDFRRCERIRWPRPVIENCDISGIKVWENERRGKISICIWFDDIDYLVVLGKRKGYVLLVTAYPVTYKNRKEDLEKEYEEYMANAAC